MLLSNRFMVAVALALGICAAVDQACAQQMITEVIPVDPVDQSNTAPAHQPSQRVSHSAVALDKDNSSSVGHHRYSSDAERARDDLLITEVKSALAEAGISNRYPVQVDADHGTVTLSGVVASADDVKAAADDAAGVHGVVAVRNLLRVH